MAIAIVEELWTRIRAAIDDKIVAAADARDQAVTAATNADTAATQTGLDRTAVAADRTHVDSQVAAIDMAFTESVPSHLQPTALTRDRLLGSPHVDARLEGLWDITTSTEDAAPILNAAASRARAENRPLFIPAPKSRIGAPDGTSAYSIYGTVDFRYLDVYCEANLVLRHATGVGVLVGDDANRRNGRVVRLGNVKHETTGYFDWDWVFPAVRVMGFMSGEFRMGNGSLVELFADGVTVADGAIAYSNFHMQRVNHLRLSGINSGWINENSFHGGSYNRITLQGDYPHDANTWYKPSVEGSHALLDFQCGQGNVVDQARSEGGTRVRFSSRAIRNTLSSLYLDSMNIMHDGFVVEEDLGEENIVTTVASQQHVPHTIFSLSPETVLTDVASPLVQFTAGQTPPTPTVPGGKIKLPTNYTTWIRTGLIPLESDNAQSATNITITMSPASRVRRFSIACDRQALWPSVWFYDERGKLIDSSVEESMRLYAGWMLSPETGGYRTSNLIYGLPITIINSRAKYMRMEIHSGVVAEAHRMVDHVTLTAYIPEGTVPGVVERMRQAINRPLFGAAAPTKGLAWPGTVIQGQTGMWRAVARVDTSVGSVVSPTEIALAAAAGIAVGDVIGILQVGGDTHWTTVAAVGGSTVTLASAPSGTVEAGTSVGTTRWVSNSFA